MFDRIKMRYQVSKTKHEFRDVDGSDVRRLTTTLGYDGGPFFSPDGALIVYRSAHPETPADRADYTQRCREAGIEWPGSHNMRFLLPE